jgi:hypothetical protein
MTNSEKLKIVRSIGSEDELRTDVLIPIFTEMGYETVDEVHGANEKGKDIVLVEKDKFGDYVYTAVIVKNKDVSNATSGTSKELVGNLSTQIAMTVASGYDCRLQSKHVDFNRISVITGGRISQTAMDTLIKVALQNRFTNIVFKDGEDVVQLIDRYLPDYYFFSSGILASYTDALRTRCNHLDELRNISAYKGEIKKLVDVFVSPTLYRVNRQEKKERRQSRPEFNKLENLLFLRNHLIVVSGPGGGKSTLVRAQVQRLLSLNARGKQLFLPVLIRAVDMVSFTSTQLEAILNDYIRSTYKLPAFDLIKLMELESCTAFIFIDGLDEIASADDRQRIHEVINEFAQRSLRHKLVLTTRDCSYSSETSFAKTQQWYLLPFRAKEVERFIARWFSSKEPNHKLMKALEEHNLLSKLPSTPLALTLLAILFDSDTHTEVPANLSELYQMFVDLLLGKWNLDRRIQSFYDSNIKEYVHTCMKKEDMRYLLRSFGK